MLPITKWGIKLLHGEWKAVPTDKDGGFCIEDSNTLINVHKQLLRSTVYEEVAQAGININSIKEQYGKLTMRIEKLSEQQGLGASLRRSLAVKRCHVACKARLDM
jgi:hypothetical protein